MNQKTKKLYFTAEFKAVGDISKDGRINSGEFSHLMMLLGFPGGRENSERLWQSAKKHGGHMNILEYIELMSNPSIETSTSTWRKLFAEFDTEGSGYASPKDVRKGLEKIGMTVGGVLSEKLKDMDKDKDGRISYAEFLKMQLHQ